MHNLYGQAAYKQVTADLKQQLRQLIREYKDGEALKIMDQQ